MTFADVLGSIRHGLGSAARFSGRDRPAMFWPYAVAVFAAMLGVVLVFFTFAMMETLARTQRLIAEHPDLLDAPLDPAKPDPLVAALTADLAGFHLAFLLVGLATVLLLAAAVARRLHDRDRSGWWGLLPLPFQAVAALLTPRVLAEFGAAPVGSPPLPFLAMMLNNLLFYVALGYLIYLLVGESTRGPNRYGPDHRQAP